MTPALPGIIAKVLVLVEKVLDEFVDLTYTEWNGNVCELAGFSGTTTVCGNAIVDLWANALYTLSGLAGTFIMALAVDIT